MKTFAIIFVMLGSRPATLEYTGDWSQPFDARLAREVPYDEAERRLRKDSTIVLFATTGGLVLRGTQQEGVALLKEWRATKSSKKAKAALNKAGKRARDRIRTKKNL